MNAAQLCDRPTTTGPGFQFNVFANAVSVADLSWVGSAPSGPSCMAFDSRGRLFVGTLSGKILILLDNNDDGVVDQVKTFATDLNAPLGIEFRANGDLYATSNVRHSDIGQVGRILRLRDTNGDDVADDISVILDGLPSNGDHQTDRLKFGPDGLLYFGQGSATDNGTPEPGRPSEGPLNGTILRINVDNPFPQPELFAKGLRNPFGMAFDPVSGALFCTDVGPGEVCQTFPCTDTSPNEKILWISQGGNYGFPNCWILDKANASCAGVTGSLAEFPPHLTPTSIAFYTGPQAGAALNQMLVTPFKRLSTVGGDLEPFVLSGNPVSGFQLTKVAGPSIADFGLVDPGDGPVDTAIDPITGDIYVARLDTVGHPLCPSEHHNVIYRIHRPGSDSLPFIGPPHPAIINAPAPAPATIAIFGRHIKAGATVMADGTPLATRQPNQLELDADLPVELTSTSHVFAITVRNPDGTLSNPRSLQVVRDTGPASPALSSITVSKKSGKVINQIIAGMKGKKLQLTADGTGFDSGAQLLINGNGLALISSSGTELVGAFTNAIVASPGTLTVQV